MYVQDTIFDNIRFCQDSLLLFLFKQKTAYEMRISDWSSDVCSSDLAPERHAMNRLIRFGVIPETVTASPASSCIRKPMKARIEPSMTSGLRTCFPCSS